MRLCCPPHTVNKVARLEHHLWSRTFQPFRSFTSTVPISYPAFVTSIHSDVPPYTPQAQPNPKARNVAVVGGGITGLAAAYNLATALPNARITLFEGRKKLGGWLESELVPVDDGEVLFEWGPRTLRNDGIGSGRHTAQLMAQLDMAQDVLPTLNTSPAAQNRYIYYPDHLVRMPGPMSGVNVMTGIFRNLMTVFQEPIFQGALKGLYEEPSVEVRPNIMQDESVGDFFTRRFGRHVADNLVSAFLHGIYAGDLYKLSAKTLFPLFWHLEQVSETGIVGAIVGQLANGESLHPLDDIQFTLQSDRTINLPEGPSKALAERLEGSSVYTFKKGLAQLAGRIEAALKESKNVEIKYATAALAFDSKTKQFHITDANRRKKPSKDVAERYDYVVATVSPPKLSETLKEQDTTNTPSIASPFSEMLDRFKTSPTAVNVMVVNLFYRNPTILPVTGFGYLLPRSIPVEQNPERALGVIFGSETSRGSSNMPSALNETWTGQDSASGTKLTVMMGGHWWSSWPLSDLPDEGSAVEMAKAVLERHLGITDAPAVAKARMQWSAIPQYEVGHHERMARLHQDLRREFGGRLKVAGSAYQGVGVNDCVQAARKACHYIREGLDEMTGLENFGQGMRWAVYKRRERALYVQTKEKHCN